MRQRLRTWKSTIVWTFSGSGGWRGLGLNLIRSFAKVVTFSLETGSFFLQFLGSKIENMYRRWVESYSAFLKRLVVQQRGHAVPNKLLRGHTAPSAAPDIRCGAWHLPCVQATPGPRGHTGPGVGAGVLLPVCSDPCQVTTPHQQSHQAGIYLFVENTESVL